jgi:hypothetical protein
MNLWRLYAYGVAQPSRGDDGFEAPSGGAVQIVEPVRAALDKALDEAIRQRPVRVQLRMSQDGTRWSPVADAVRVMAIGAAAAAEQSSAALAVRLGGEMDMRSKAGLFVVAVRRVSATDDLREIALWMFPSDTVLRFQSRRHQIEVIENVFSQTSRQRKLALFRGRGARADFRAADVLDFQTRDTGRPVAAFWLDSFLDAVPDLTNEQGSKFLADIFLRASRAVTEDADRAQVQAAVMALRHSPSAARSMTSVAEEFLSGGAKAAFEQAARLVVPDQQTRDSDFRLDSDKFAEYVGYRFFRLGEGTAVIAPLDAVGPGKTVQVEGDAPEDVVDRRVLRVEDVIVEEKLRRGRG